MNGPTEMGHPDKGIYVQKRYIVAGIIALAIVIALALGFFGQTGQLSTQTATSGGGSPAGPAGLAATPTPTITQAIIAPWTTPEQIRDSVLISNPTDNTWLGVARRASNVTAALCQQGFKARTVTFRLVPPSLFRAVTVVKYKEGYIYLYPEPNTPAVFLGSSDNPIPKEEELTGVKLYTGTDFFGDYC